ncbi:unnamed protein product [Adineta ricciae]|uniref:Uncharacterized protein n=1 Tax=Adineta ricciae TaxID=249248 RepID=A0A814QZ41_ADIRI|nr:unnamed protein product [Adineta ricciae]CAF1506107.1 unnamed protein product [Adineta ricciae]
MLESVQSPNTSDLFSDHKKLIISVVVSITFIALLLYTLTYNEQFVSREIFALRTLTSSSKKQGKWKKNQLVVIPAIWKEIDWANDLSWPAWLRQGLEQSHSSSSQSYRVHLYQRIDPNSTAPYNWPYCQNVHEEAGVYLKFIYDYYHDLPDRMLFIQGNPTRYTQYPIEKALCIRDDVHYANINLFWIKQRKWSEWNRDPTNHISPMYECVVRVLELFDFVGAMQVNPDNKKPIDENTVTTLCCAQFYVTKERIHHYTYKQWAAAYRASLQPYCTTSSQEGITYFRESFEHLWHVILGLQAVNMPLAVSKTNTDPCHTYRPSCKGSPCSRTE